MTRTSASHSAGPWRRNSHARSAGIEFTSDVDLTDTLTLSVNYTYTDSENLATNQLLEGRIERWLHETFGVEIEFEAADALAKLERFGLLRRAADRLTVPSPDETIERLTHRRRPSDPSKESIETLRRRG